MKPAKKLSDQYTRCPHCSTLYALFQKIDVDSLVTVSCGTCQNTFAAKDHLTLPKKKVVIPDKNNPYQARLSQAALSATSTKTPNFSATTENTAKKPNKWRWATAAIGIFLGLNLGIGAYVWLVGGSIVQNPLVQGWLTTVCGVLNCKPANYYDPSKLDVEQHSLVADPNDPTKLQLKALVKNTSAFAQPLGRLQVEIQDLGGKVVNNLTFTTTEYAPSLAGQLLEPGQAVNIAVTLNQPIPDLFSYKVNFI